MSPRQGERPGNLLACPNCKSADHIGEIVTGWREISGARAVSGGGFVVDRGAFARVEDAEHVAFFCSGPKCNVDEEIAFRRMVQLDRDGKPLPALIPGQGALGA
jgi:hypothetical protein